GIGVAIYGGALEERNDVKRFRTLSIRSKFTLIVMTTTCVSLILSLVTLGLLDRVNFRTRMGREGITRARIIANNSTAALSFGDPRAEEEILSALSADPHLGAAIIFDAEEKPFARYIRPGWKVAPPVKLEQSSAVFRSHCLEVLHPVILDGTRLGTVLLQSDLDELHARFVHGILL